MQFAKVILFFFLISAPAFAQTIDYSACEGVGIFQDHYELGTDGKMRKPLKADPNLIKYAKDENSETAITKIPAYKGNPKGMLTITLNSQDGRPTQYTMSANITGQYDGAFANANISTGSSLSTGTSISTTFNAPNFTNIALTKKYGYEGNKCFVSEISESTNGAPIVTYNAELCAQVEEAANALGESKIKECSSVLGKIDGIRNAFQNRPDMQGKKLGYTYTHDFSVRVQELSRQHPLDGMNSDGPVDAVNLLASCRIGRNAFPSPAASSWKRALGHEKVDDAHALSLPASEIDAK